MFYSKQYRTNTHTQWRSHVLRPANATNSHIFSLHLTTTSQILANSVFYFFFRSFHNFRGIKQMTLHAIHIACATEIEYNFLAMWQKRTELRTFAILHNSLQALLLRKFRELHINCARVCSPLSIFFFIWFIFLQFKFWMAWHGKHGKHGKIRCSRATSPHMTINIKILLVTVRMRKVKSVGGTYRN